MPDARLARSAARGDERAFAEIYRRYNRRLYRYCLSIVGRAEDAQDALQNTMVKALRALPGERRRIQLKPWLYRIAHNESIELLRKRHDEVEFDPELAASDREPAETAALRERLRQLLGDLCELPERQRGAILMRELGGLGFEQIGEAFDTSAAVARQTVYEARLSLRQLEAGRNMTCDQVMRLLSDADGRITRRRDVKAHLRACQACREFGDAIDQRGRDLAAISPLPAVASLGILHAILGGGQGATGGGLAATAGAGKAAVTSVAIKSAATVAVVATVGVSVADRGGLIDVGLPAGDGGTAVTREPTSPANVDAGTPISTPQGTSPNAKSKSPGARSHIEEATRAGGDPSVGQEDRESSTPPTTATAPDPHGNPVGLPAASEHGQQTAAAHKATPGSSRGKARGHAPKSPGHPSQKGSNGKARGTAHAAPEAPGHAKKDAKGGPPGQPPAHGETQSGLSQSPPGHAEQPAAPLGEPEAQNSEGSP